MVQLGDLDGLGPAKIDKLARIGVTDVVGLAELDIRKLEAMPFGREILRRAKQQARRALDREGVPYRRAAYGNRAPRFDRLETQHALPMANPGRAAPVVSGQPLASGQSDPAGPPPTPHPNDSRAPPKGWRRLFARR